MFLQIKQILEINMNLGLNTDPYHSPLMALSIAPLFRKSRLDLASHGTSNTQMDVAIISARRSVDSIWVSAMKSLTSSRI